MGQTGLSRVGGQCRGRKTGRDNSKRFAKVTQKLIIVEASKNINIKRV